MTIRIFATGYSSRSLDAWLRMLDKHRIVTLIDVRSLGLLKSTARRPEFSKEFLEERLPKLGFLYKQIPLLGGYRTQADSGLSKSESPNLGLNLENGFSSEAFRHFADYMYANPNFQKGIERLLKYASRHTSAFFCCEGWERRCHRNLISDYLTAFNLARVYHIKSGIRADRHQRLEIGKKRKGKLIYPE